MHDIINMPDFHNTIVTLLFEWYSIYQYNININIGYVTTIIAGYDIYIYTRITY